MVYIVYNHASEFIPGGYFASALLFEVLLLKIFFFFWEIFLGSVVYANMSLVLENLRDTGSLRPTLAS